MISVADVVRTDLIFGKTKPKKIGSCEYKHINQSNDKIVCTNENITGIYKTESDCSNCLGSTGKMWSRNFTKHGRG